MPRGKKRSPVTPSGGTARPAAALCIAAPELRPPAETVPQDWEKLQRYLAALGLRFETDPTPRQFAGGFANLNYLIRLDGCEAVLRRPPLGILPPGAYDMARESKILTRLWQRFPLAPRSLHFCAESAVLGAPFQITEYRRGISLRNRLPEPIAADSSRCGKLGYMLIDVLTQLHRVDPATVGLAELGRPQGFLERALEGWVRRAQLAVQGWASPQTSRLMTELSAWLRRHRVPDGPAVLLHNDFKLDNLLLDSLSLEPVAVLDWDQGTRGDGLFDLATLLSYWVEAADPQPMHRLAQMPTALRGFPTRREAAERYAASSGRELSDFRFHRVLAQFKTAVIYQQLHARWRTGGTLDPRYAEFGEIAEGLLELAQEIAAGRTF